MIEIDKYSEIKRLLDKATLDYNRFEFIELDPVQIPHAFSRKEDIEIAGFLTATISWGQRKSIIKNAYFLMDLMDNTPYDFIIDADKSDWNRVSQFVHRTFNGNDCLFFLQSLKNIYQNHGGLENVFNAGYEINNSTFESLKHFRNIFMSINHNERVGKHISDVNSNSTAKRLNMFLRWMVRTDENGVDFGLWKRISPAVLMLPLDVHTGNVSRFYGLLERKQNDWKAVEEITTVLRLFDSQDPIKYDYALFGIGVNNGIK